MIRKFKRVVTGRGKAADCKVGSEKKRKQKVEDGRSRKGNELVDEDEDEEVVSGDAGSRRTIPQRKAAKRRKFQNPFDVEKSKYNLRVFQAVQPFVNVTNIDEIKDRDEMIVVPGDKVGDGQLLHPNIVEMAWDEIWNSVYATRQSMIAKTELGGRLIHGAYLTALRVLTRKRTGRTHLSTLVDVATQRSRLDEKQDQGTVSSEEEREEEEEEEAEEDEKQQEEQKQEKLEDAADEVEDFFVKAGGEVIVSLDDITSDENILLAHEGDEDGPDADAGPRTNYDFKVKVRDKRLGEYVTVLIVECQWEKLSINKIFQAAGYAMKAAGANMQLGRYKPIYLQSWGESNWRHGILIPHGKVTVEGGLLVGASGYARQKEVMKQLQRRLQVETRDLRKKYDIDSYPDGDYVVADFYVFHRKYPVPFLTCAYGKAMQFFIQTLLRIVLGDRVLSFTPREFRDIIEVRKNAQQQECAQLKNGGN